MVTSTFDIAGPLPEGTTVLEASAGTGKTWTVGALVTRYVAEGEATLDEMLLITFSRAASQELRERVRAALVEAERVLADPAAADRSDALVARLLAADEAEPGEPARRLRDALAGYDAATIATTHEFCQLVLRSLGVAGDTDARARLVEDLTDLVVEVTDDLYLARYAGEESPPFPLEDARTLARDVVEDPQARITPDLDDESTTGGARVGFACAVRAEVDRRKRKLGILSFDDLLSRLAAALQDEDAPARMRMQARWRIVMVDEFQDTDPVQWKVIQRAFVGRATVVLIGDPKQAIYRFRGGDVVTYLRARDTAGTLQTLGTNWRSDAALLESLQVVLEGAALGHPDIVVHPVEAHHPGSRLVGAPESAPFRIRQVVRDSFALTRDDCIAAGDARAHIARDCAADIARLLDSGATWDGSPVEAGHVAVLVSDRKKGMLVQEQLRSRGIPAVVAGGGQVFKEPAADDWLALLEGLAEPHRSDRVRAAALTCFFGHTVAELDTGGDVLTDEVSDRLRGWALLLRGHGVAALFAAAEALGLGERVLRRVGGERFLTDLRHLAQVLHEAATRDRLGLTGLLGWFHEERRQTASATERTRRLDSDAAAVQIVTIHASKGLQYPVVYLPFACEAFVFPTVHALYHDDEGERCLDVARAGPDWTDHDSRHRAEEAGDELRDLYVSLTRAQSQVVTWWAPTANTRNGGLHRLLFGRGPGAAVVPDQCAVPTDEEATHRLTAVAGAGGPVLEASVVPDSGLSPRREPRPAMDVRHFDREVDADWRRTSYSGLIRAEVPLPGVTSEREEPVLDDEPEPVDDGVGPAVPEPDEAMVSPMADLPAGADFGSLVHAVLEHADPNAPDLKAELRAQVVDQLRWWPVAVDPELLAEALVPLHHTPLGPLMPGLTLTDLPLDDRLRELDFEIPLVGGDHRDATREIVLLRDVAPLLRRHLDPGDPMRDYAGRLEQPVLGDQPLRGYLSGSIDVVFRVPAGSGQRFVVADWKTNMLGEPGRQITADDYAPDRLADAMLHSHYPLQALIYSVVLHRFLRWRLTGYDPAQHLGGVVYLYLRGMCGPETPVVDGHPAGVFSWSLPPDLVVALSDLLDRSPAEVSA
jgi:exodeoxyribonuclease V beta subunit